MDDLKISSYTLEDHVDECGHLCAEARKSGFEFKLAKGQFKPT